MWQLSVYPNSQLTFNKKGKKVAENEAKVITRQKEGKGIKEY